MSETQSLAEAEPATPKPARKPPAKTKARAAPRAKAPAKAAPEKAAQKTEDIPAGFDVCYVAIPGRVSRGQGVQKAKAGERVVGPAQSIDDLELRGVAFRNEDEAKAAFTSFKRKREAEIKRAVEAERIRRERRARIKAELYGPGKELDWNG